ncbi:NACHT domain-containing NTPase [Microbacterium thalassium]|uniref:NACHT domain-containing protein n=2 Tax=Microbacterium TaxID=33882 RepID=UPI0016607700|nr:NACHT domain-containing protein [Microbacterium thalassium]
MVGREVESRPGAVPSRVYLEAPEDVDDIVVQMSDGTTWYLQCKRSAGVDAPFRKTLAQWCGQSYLPGDRLGLVSREFRGALRSIQRTIDQLGDDHAPALNKRQLADLSTIKSELELAGCSEPDRLIQDALFLNLATETAADPHRQVACALLSMIVPQGKAESAFRALESLMQESAAARRWTDMADWLAALEAAGIEVRADISGVPAAAAQAKRQAIDAYRGRLSRPHDLLALSTLAPRLAEVRVEGLLQGWEVRWSDRMSADVLRVARRNTRFILTGLPGIGKSEAMRQLAADFALNTEAPVPVLFDLKESLATIQSGGSLTLETILLRVSEQVVSVDPSVTVVALREALLSGNAILMVDGLDEARKQLGSVAANLAQIVAALPAQTGFILSTRPSAAEAALQLGLPTVTLESPTSLERSLPEIVKALVPEDVAEPDAWVDERIRRVMSASEGADAIWKVPLLATLATLRIAAGKADTGNPVELLSNVIDDSVTAWEALKASHSDGLDPAMRSSMLTDGFITIGRLINTSPATLEEAESAVAQQLEPWDLALPLRKELARQIIHFWDERVGVFLVTGDHLVARSRQFAELADARRATQLSQAAKREWLATALADPDLRNTVQLAVQTDETLRTFLLDMADRGADEPTRNRAVEWAASFASNWTDTSLESQRRLIDIVANAAEDALPAPQPGTSWIERIRAGDLDGEGWHFAVQLARLRSSQSLREHQHARVRRLGLPPQRRALIDLLFSLRTAEDERRPLNDIELTLVADLLDSSKPAKGSKGFRNGTFVIESVERYVEGTGDVIEMAVEHVDQLPEGAAEKFLAIAKRLTHGTFEKVATELSARGYKVDFSGMLSALSPLREFAELYADKHGLGWLLSLLASWPEENSPGTPPEPWRWGEISDLISIIGWAQGSIGDLKEVAKTSDDLRAIWIETVVGAYGLDRERLATEARAILLQDDDAMNDTLRQVCTTRLVAREVSRQLTCEEAVALAGCFSSGAESIVSLTAQLTVNTGCSGASEMIEALDVPMTWQNRFLATVVSLATSAGDPVLVEKYRNADSSCRAALARYASSVTDREVFPLAELREDSDASVRRHCDGDIESAEIWTCSHCWTENPIGVDSCAKCHLHPGWLVRSGAHTDGR